MTIPVPGISPLKVRGRSPAGAPGRVPVGTFPCGSGAARQPDADDRNAQRRGGQGIWAAGGVNEAGVGMTATETITSNPRVLGA